MNKILTKKKSRTTTYSVVLSALIGVISFLPYLHDFEFFKGRQGFSGFGSLRVGIWVICLFIIAISGWMVAFLSAKHKSYRFAILAPIFMLLFQLFVYILDSRKSIVNDFNVKVILNFAVFILIGYLYFKFRGKRE